MRRRLNGYCAAEKRTMRFGKGACVLPANGAAKLAEMSSGARDRGLGEGRLPGGDIRQFPNDPLTAAIAAKADQPVLLPLVQALNCSPEATLRVLAGLGGGKGSSTTAGQASSSKAMRMVSWLGEGTRYCFTMVSPTRRIRRLRSHNGMRRSLVGSPPEHGAILRSGRDIADDCKRCHSAARIPTSETTKHVRAWKPRLRLGRNLREASRGRLTSTA